MPADGDFETANVKPTLRMTTKSARREDVDLLPFEHEPGAEDPETAPDAPTVFTNSPERSKRTGGACERETR